MEQRALAAAFLPKGVNLETLMALLEITSTVCPLAEAKGHSCPLCQRELGEHDITLFRKYHELLNGMLEKDIETLEASSQKAQEHLKALSEINPEKWKELVAVPPALLIEAIDATKSILADSNAVRDPSPESIAALDAVETLEQKIRLLADGKRLAIEAATIGRATLSDATGCPTERSRSISMYKNMVAAELEEVQGCPTHDEVGGFMGMRPLVLSLPSFGRSQSKRRKHTLTWLSQISRRASIGSTSVLPKEIWSLSA